MNTPFDEMNDPVVFMTSVSDGYQFSFIERDELPTQAFYDNWLEIDAALVDVFTTRESGWFASSFALQIWAEAYCGWLDAGAVGDPPSLIKRGSNGS